MKKAASSLLLIALVLSIFSCNNLGTNPEKIFNLIGLNSNKVPSSFKRAFDEIRGQKKIGNLKVYVESSKRYEPATAAEYVKAHYKNLFDEDIKNLKELKGDDESQPIIDAGMAMFQYANEVYNSEYPQIAKMIDEGIADEQIDAAIAKIDDNQGVELDKLRAKAMDLLLPYADKHGVEYKTMNTPF